MMTVVCAIEMCLQARDIDNLGTKILSTRGFHSDFCTRHRPQHIFQFFESISIYALPPRDLALVAQLR